MNTVRLKRGLSTFDLKILGITLMFVDHIHQMFYPFGVPDWLDWFGRPVATLFFFISVVGFSHTHDKKKYMQRLYLSMVLMAFFTYFLGNIVHYDEVVLMNNIFRDLFIGTVMMYAIDLFTEGKIQVVGKRLLQVFSYSFYQSCSHYLSRCYFLVLLSFKTKLFLC
ncbi:TraX family protein [Enterococcus lactis]